MPEVSHSNFDRTDPDLPSSASGGLDLELFDASATQPLDLSLDVNPLDRTHPNLPVVSDDMTSGDARLGATDPMGRTHPGVLPDSASPDLAAALAAAVAFTDTVDESAMDHTVDLRPKPWTQRRVLVVSADWEERMYLRTRLALAKWVWVDDAVTTLSAHEQMNSRPYSLAFINLDAPEVDGISVARRFCKDNPDAKLVITTGAFAEKSAWDVSAWWRQWRLRSELDRTTSAVLLNKPLDPQVLIRLLAEWSLSLAALEASTTRPPAT